MLFTRLALAALPLLSSVFATPVAVGNKDTSLCHGRGSPDKGASVLDIVNDFAASVVSFLNYTACLTPGRTDSGHQGWQRRWIID